MSELGSVNFGVDFHVLFRGGRGGGESVVGIAEIAALRSERKREREREALTDEQGSKQSSVTRKVCQSEQDINMSDVRCRMVSSSSSSSSKGPGVRW